MAQKDDVLKEKRKEEKAKIGNLILSKIAPLIQIVNSVLKLNFTAQLQLPKLNFLSGLLLDFNPRHPIQYLN